MSTLSRSLFLGLVLTTMPAVAIAQEAPGPRGDGTGDSGDTETPGTDAGPTDADALPKPQSDDDVQPMVAQPGIPSGGIVRQAGVGGLVGYGRAGVLEIGGSAGFTFASEYRSLTLAPSVGWFLADNFEISAIMSITNIKSGDADSATLASAVLEPSYHIPLNRTVFGFLGLGLGGSHVSGLGSGFAIAPRVGGNFMVGRSGVLTPALSYQYTTIGSDMGGVDGSTVVVLTSALAFNLGFTAMW
jgi:hypothetical protein